MCFQQGAPEIVLSKCTFGLNNWKSIKKDENLEHSVNGVYSRFAKTGERVLACAMAVVRRAELTPKTLTKLYLGKMEGGMTFVGLFSLEDPLKPGESPI